MSVNCLIEDNTTRLNCWFVDRYNVKFGCYEPLENSRLDSL